MNLKTQLFLPLCLLKGSHRHRDLRHFPEVHQDRRAARLDRLRRPVLQGRLAVPARLLVRLHADPEGAGNHRQRREPPLQLGSDGGRLHQLLLDHLPLKPRRGAAQDTWRQQDAAESGPLCYILCFHRRLDGIQVAACVFEFTQYIT